MSPASVAPSYRALLAGAMAGAPAGLLIGTAAAAGLDAPLAGLASRQPVLALGLSFALAVAAATCATTGSGNTEARTSPVR